MENDKKSSKEPNVLAGQTMDQARVAMENYLNFFQKNMSAAPWAGTELNKKVADNAQKNVNSAFEFAQKLTHAKDLQDVVRIQTEFFQTQLKSLTEQAKDLGETATKAVTDAMKGPFNPAFVDMFSKEALPTEAPTKEFLKEVACKETAIKEEGSQKKRYRKRRHRRANQNGRLSEK